MDQTEITELEVYSDKILAAPTVADLERLEDRLSVAIQSESFNTSSSLIYRWALVAEKRSKMDDAFDRWLQALRLSPNNHWFLSRCFEVGAFMHRWQNLLQLSDKLSRYVVQHALATPTSLRRSIKDACFAVASGALVPAQGDTVWHERELFAVQLYLESCDPPMQVVQSFTVEFNELLYRDGALHAICSRYIDRILFYKGWRDTESSVAAIVLYLSSYVDNPRPDFAQILSKNIHRLSLHHFETIFLRSHNRKLGLGLHEILGASLAGALAFELLQSESRSERNDLESYRRLQQALLVPGDAVGRQYEVRFAEHFIATLEARLTNQPTSSTVTSPSISRPHKPLAICLYGQMRGFERAVPTWGPILDGVDFDIFVSTWRVRGRRPLHAGVGFSDRVLPVPLARAYDAMCQRYDAHSVRSRYPSLLELLSESPDVDEVAIRDVFPNAMYVRIDEDDDPYFAQLSTQEKMFFRGRTSFALCESSGRQYTNILRIRPDIFVLGGNLAHFIGSKESEQSDGVLWADAEFRFDSRQGFILGDRVALSSPAVMKKYLEIWDRRLDARPGMSGFERSVHAHRSLAYHLVEHGLIVKRLPIEFGNMAEYFGAPTSALREAIMRDASGRMDEVDRIFVAALDACDAAALPSGAQ